MLNNYTNILNWSNLILNIMIIKHCARYFTLRLDGHQKAYRKDYQRLCKHFVHNSVKTKVRHEMNTWSISTFIPWYLCFDKHLCGIWLTNLFSRQTTPCLDNIVLKPKSLTVIIQLVDLRIPVSNNNEIFICKMIHIMQNRS